MYDFYKKKGASDFEYGWGDKEYFHISWTYLNTPYIMMPPQK